MMTVKMFLEEQEKIPWPALEYVIGQINYGGRVTDDLDRGCIMSILRKYITERVLDDQYTFTPSRTYFAPAEGSLESYREYLHLLPTNEAPEVFGMHSNANITFQLQVCINQQGLNMKQTLFAQSPTPFMIRNLPCLTIPPRAFLGILGRIMVSDVTSTISLAILRCCTCL